MPRRHLTQPRRLPRQSRSKATVEALVAAVLRWHLERMIETFCAGLPELAHAPLPVAIRGVLECTFDAIGLNPELQKVIVEQVPRTGLLVRSREFEQQLGTMLGGYLEFRREELRVENVALAVRVLVHAVDAVVTAAVVDDPTLTARTELVEELTALVMGYVAKPV